MMVMQIEPDYFISEVSASCCITCRECASRLLANDVVYFSRICFTVEKVEKGLVLYNPQVTEPSTHFLFLFDV